MIFRAGGKSVTLKESPPTRRGYRAVSLTMTEQQVETVHLLDDLGLMLTIAETRGDGSVPIETYCSGYIGGRKSTHLSVLPNGNLVRR